MLRIKAFTLAKFLLFTLLSSCIVTTITLLESWASEPIKVGIFPNKPVVYFDNEPKGLFVEILNNIAKKEDWQLEYITCELKNCLNLIKSKDLDLLPSVGKSKERQKYLTYSNQSIWTFWGTIYSRDHKIQGILDLKNKKVGVRKKNKITIELQKILSEFSIPVQYIEFDNYEELLSAAQNNKLDTIAVNNTYGFDTLRDTDLQKTPIVFTPFSAYFATQKTGQHQDKLAVIDAYVKKIKIDENSFLHTFENKWLNPPDPYWTGQKIGIVSAIFLVFTIFIMALWRYRSILDINKELTKYRDHLEVLVKNRTSELSEANKALTESEEKHRTLSDTAFEGIVIVEKGSFLEVNKTMSDMFGYTTSELLKMEPQDLLVPEEVEGVMAKIQSDYEHLYETNCQRKDGSTFIAEIRPKMFIYRGRKVRGAAIRDISENRNAEIELKETKAMLEAAMDGSQAAIAIADAPDGRLIYVNKAGLFIRGGTNEELVKDVSIEQYVSSWQIHHFDGTLYKTNEVPLARAIMNGETCTDEFILKKPGGEDRIVLANAAPIRDDKGNIKYGIVVFFDITKRKQAEMALKKNSLEWSTAMDASDDAIYLLDLNCSLLRANKAFYRMTGSNPQNSIGEHIEKIIHPKGAKTPCSICLAQEKREDASIIMEADNPQNFSERPVSITVKIVRDDQNQPISIFVNIHDLTTERQIDNYLQQLQKYQSLNSLAAGIAHNFNNILTAVIGNQELALEKMTDERDEKRLIKASFKAAKRAAKLSTKMLQYVGQAKVEMQQIEIDKLCEETINVLQSQFDANIELLLDSKENALIHGDVSLISQIITNLITNAAESIGDMNGKIRIQIGQKFYSEKELQFPHMHIELSAGEYVYLSVIDDGPGMGSDIVPRAFEPFFTTKFTGRGMGLATVLGNMRTHNGGVYLEPNQENGITSTVLFPAIAPQVIPVEKTLKAIPTIDNLEGTVLLVDDEQMLRDLGREVLKQIGFKVILASDGVEALELFDNNKNVIDLILLDIAMPRLNGLETLKKIRTMSDVPAIMITGYSVEEISGQFNNIANVDLMQKPYNIKQLRNKIQKLISSDETYSDLTP